MPGAPAQERAIVMLLGLEQGAPAGVTLPAQEVQVKVPAAQVCYCKRYASR